MRFHFEAYDDLFKTYGLEGVDESEVGVNKGVVPVENDSNKDVNGGKRDGECISRPRPRLILGYFFWAKRSCYLG